MQLFGLSLSEDLTTPLLIGGSGWSAVGILVFVVRWLLLKHLPEKDKLIKGIIADHASVEKAQRDTHSALEREQREACAAAQDKLMEHCRVELREIAARLPKGSGPP